MRRRSTGSNSVLDDRGEDVSLYRGALNLLASSHLPRRQLRRLRKAAKLPSVDRDFVLFGDLEEFVLVPLLILGYIGLLYVHGNRTIWFVPAVIVVWSVCKTVMFGYRRTRRQMRASTLTRTMLQEGLCPSCAYQLCGLPAQDDGCTVCPECGGAWRLPARKGGTHAPPA